MENPERSFRQIICLPIRFYQYLVSPCIGDVCRFYPSCSSYAVEAITVHGAFRGVWLSVKRLLRCHPWSMGGFDPVLPLKENS
ncbi:putative membrane protein insertion efficiency factor [Legionella geestiana]|uniref:Putative membrane protein insertion efficiency factor n=1 Tax=Legionella geestiana TaxID=45065 RepID=A0A0W0TZJ2_9GAMM|nr:membrane protein insertion efficiency factor YidD [Legionella geestiana]KTD01203.1 putative membrane protein insertion efficiency factor [Legionella geestiana]QBS12322.1 membrane protein insertion efficiency factor YidD [Legionella geestiana]QDQ39964.1 membrane protein insertion efficiency factor YidD [Legionella geestiana]STX55244.1 Protein YidD [Legionella geestiana]